MMIRRTLTQQSLCRRLRLLKRNIHNQILNLWEASKILRGAKNFYSSSWIWNSSQVECSVEGGSYTQSQGDTMLDAARVLGSTDLCHVQALKDRALRSATASHVISWFDSWDWIFFLQVYKSASVHVQGNKFHFIYRSPIDVVGDILSRLVWSDLHFSFNRENVPEYGSFHSIHFKETCGLKKRGFGEKVVLKRTQSSC